MTRDDFSEKLANRGGLTVTKARELTNLIFDGDDGIIARELSKVNGKVGFAGFGVFSTKVLPSRVCRNPSTGTSFQAPAKKVPRFAAGKNLRAKLANKTPDTTEA